MKKFEVYIKGLELKNVTSEEVEEYKNGYIRTIINKYNGLMNVTSCDPVEPSSIRKFDTLEEANNYYNQLKAKEVSSYYWGNNILNFNEVVLNEIEVDDDGDEIGFEIIKNDYLEIN